MLDLKSYVLVLSRKCLLSTKGIPASAACTTNQMGRARATSHSLPESPGNNQPDTNIRSFTSISFLGATGKCVRISSFCSSWHVLEGGVAFTACVF